MNEDRGFSQYSTKFLTRPYFFCYNYLCKKNFFSALLILYPILY